MEFVGIEKQLFEELVHKFEYLSGRVPVSEHLAPHLADTP